MNSMIDFLGHRSAADLRPLSLRPALSAEVHVCQAHCPTPPGDACALPHSALRRLPASSQTSAGLVAHFNLASALACILRLLSHSAMPLRSAPAVLAGQRAAVFDRGGAA